MKGFFLIDGEPLLIDYRAKLCRSKCYEVSIIQYQIWSFVRKSFEDAHDLKFDILKLPHKDFMNQF